MYFRTAVSYVKEHPFWFVVFIFLLIFFSLVPISGDDFTFLAYRSRLGGIADYVAASGFMYENLNGRVIGNMSELILIGSPVLSVLIRAVVVFIILFLTVRLLNIRSISLRNVLVLFLFCAPIGIFHQTYSWSAGFYNYVTPVAVLAVIVWLIFLYIAEARHKVKQGVLLASLLILSVAVGLFAENITLGWIATTLVGVVVAMLKFRNVLLPSAVTLAGALIGAAIMFGSGAYQRIAEGGDGYRQIPSGVGGTLRTIKDNAVAYSDYFISDYTLLPVALSIVGVLLVLARKPKLPSRLQKRVSPQVLVRTLVAVLIASPLYFIISNDFSGMRMLPGYLYSAYAAFDFLVVVFYVAALIVAFFLYISDTRIRYVTSVLLVASVAYTAPLLAVNPFGGRNFYISYVFLVLALVLSAAYAFAGFIRKYEQRYLIGVTRTGLIIAAALYLGIFSVISIHEAKNHALAVSQIREGKTDIVLKKYPFDRFIQDAHNSMKATRVYGECYCTYASCRGCSDVVVRFE